jgi:polygalacturonase
MKYNTLLFSFCVLLSFFTLSAIAQDLSNYVNPENSLLKMGYLDVTLFGADSKGEKISTDAIRKAVKVARENELVVYFPSGTYLVDDTIRCIKHSYLRNGTWATSGEVNQLIGCAENRPLIKLAQGAKRFQDPENPMPVFWIYAMSAWGQQKDCEGSTDPLCGQSNVSFNQVVMNIDFDLGGNPGAVAIRSPGAQGATIENVSIDAEGAFAGLFNPPGQAGGCYNVEIKGGQYAVYLERVGRRHQGKFIILTGCRFINQEKAVFHIDLSHPMVVTGFHIVKDEGPVNVGMPSDGLSMIDGVIELKNGELFQNSDRSLYLQNVYVKGATAIAKNMALNDPGLWSEIKEYSYCAPQGSTNLIDGVKNSETFVSLEKVSINSISDFADEIIHRHVWKEEDFPSFASKNTVNVKDPVMMKGMPAMGDGISDDTKALEYAIANFENVFLPKGRYSISNTLSLGADTKLVGISRTHTSIVASEDWKSGSEAPLIQTVDDRDANTILAFISVRSRDHHLLWRAGRNSWVRDVSAGEVLITGNGGGRWPAFMNVGSQLLIKDTHEPLYMYATNPERAKDPEWAIEGSSNIKLFYVKTEAGTDGHSIMTSLRIKDSHNIMVFGSTGNVQLNGSDGMAMIEVEDCEDILITHANPFKSGPDWFVFKENYKGKEYTIRSDVKLALYKRGTTAF